MYPLIDDMLFVVNLLTLFSLDCLEEANYELWAVKDDITELIMISW